MTLLNKLKQNSRIKATEILEDSKLFNSDMTPTDIPMLNVALSGSFDGGLSSGLTIFGGPSKSFKSMYSLIIAGAYLKKYPEAVLLFYDSEFGTPETYWKQCGVDRNRVIHTPVSDIEELKFDLVNQLENLDRKDKVIIVIDSIGNLASKKEIEDAKNEKAVADMSRAKALKGLFRMVTPYLTIKDVPLIAIAHTYQTMEMFSKAVISGGCVVAGTKIQTENGLVKIEDIRVGDKILTLNGYIPASAVWNPDTLTVGTPECYEIEFEDGYKVVCSENHRFLVNKTWVETKDLIEGIICTII